MAKPRYFSCAETAALIRKALKEAFANVKFSVKSKTYSGGASVRVLWTDGPNSKQVEAVINRFSGSYFDGMQDFKGSKYHMINGQQVRFGADFIFTERSYSDAAVEKAIARVWRNFAGNFASAGIAPPTVEEYRTGRLIRMQIPLLNDQHSRNISFYVGDALARNSDRIGVAVSPTAAGVFQTHTDGHGQSEFDAVKATL